VVFLGSRANAETVPRIHVVPRASYVALPENFRPNPAFSTLSNFRYSADLQIQNSVQVLLFYPLLHNLPTVHFPTLYLASSRPLPKRTSGHNLRASRAVHFLTTPPDLFGLSILIIVGNPGLQSSNPASATVCLTCGRTLAQASRVPSHLVQLTMVEAS
jgi:hypothetical protein